MSSPQAERGMAGRISLDAIVILGLHHKSSSSQVAYIYHETLVHEPTEAETRWMISATTILFRLGNKARQEVLGRLFTSAS